MELLRSLLAGSIRFSLYTFLVFSLVVSLFSGFADIVHYSRNTSDRNERALEATDDDEEFIGQDFTPLLITGITAFLMFAAASVLTVRFFRKIFDTKTHILIVFLTILASFIFFLPRPPVGTGTDGMKEVFSYLMVLGIINSALYRTFILDCSPAGGSS